ncbi:glycosyltransferase family 4 protein [Metabacillus idriensis]|uniref:glycosyltransferase family 4 protein n=1 Tax=Metabacillus idriensis TaxID=324768 RepID=UPI00174B74D0|nr:glycosyltransferase [Metabacillus idriensis]
MNILFVYYVPSGGVETLNRQRSTALKKHNINCHFLYYNKVRELVNNHNAPTFITNVDTEIKKIIDDGNYSAIIITSDYKSLARFRNLGYKGKLILEIQGLGPKHIAKLELTNAIPYVNNYGDGLLNPRTPHIMQLFDELFLSTPKYNFNNCFDYSNFTYKFLPVNDHPIIAWIGRIEDNKNWREFLGIGHQIITQHNPYAKLYMFEDPTLSSPQEREAFNQQINLLNLKDNLTIFSNVPNYKMAELFSEIGDSKGFLCSTSKVEGAPYSLLEAMSCRCPVLTTDSDGVKSSIIHNKTGKYYTLGNISEGVKEAIELITDIRLRNSIRINALQHLKENFSQEQYCLNFIKMLNDLGVEKNS